MRSVRSVVPLGAAVVAVVLSGAGLSACAASGTGSLAPAPQTERAGAPSNAVAAGRSLSPLSVGRLGHASAAKAEIGGAVMPLSPLVVRSGNVVLSVTRARLVEVFNAISAAAGALGGFVASSSSVATGGGVGDSLVLRVPSARFGDLVAKIDTFGKVRSEQQVGEDVTGQSIDLTARIENLESEEGALRTLMSHAGSIPSILKVQDQLFAVQGEVEQLSAEESSLVDRATYATLSVGLVPLAAPVARLKAPSNAIVHAARLALHNSAAVIHGIIVALGWGFPIVVAVLIVLGLWRARRSSVRRDAPTSAS